MFVARLRGVGGRPSRFPRGCSPGPLEPSARGAALLACASLAAISLTGPYWFDIRSGQINYPGLLRIQSPTGSDGFFGWLQIRFVNRSMLARKQIEREHPDLIARLPMRYTGPGRDRFLEEFEQATRAAGYGACAGCAAETWN